MNIDPIKILVNSQKELNLGPVATLAIQFIEGARYKILQSPTVGQSSFSVVKMYEIRMSLEKFHKNAFVGLEESIASLRKKDISVHLVAIEAKNGVISLWVKDDLQSLAGLVISKFED